jgi:hypothetical protein
VCTKVTFWHSAEYGSDFRRNSGEIPRNSAEFRGITPELRRNHFRSQKIPRNSVSAEFRGHPSRELFIGAASNKFAFIRNTRAFATINIVFKIWSFSCVAKLTNVVFVYECSLLACSLYLSYPIFSASSMCNGSSIDLFDFCCNKSWSLIFNVIETGMEKNDKNAILRDKSTGSHFFCSWVRYKLSFRWNFMLFEILYRQFTFAIFIVICPNLFIFATVYNFCYTQQVG